MFLPEIILIQDLAADYQGSVISLIKSLTSRSSPFIL